MFSPPTYISIGDEFDKRQTSNKLEKIGAKTFVVQARRHPHLLDSTFTPFVSLSNGVPYRASTTYNQSSKSESNRGDSDQKAKIDLPPFRPPGASHKSSGKGDYYGTFCEKNIPKHESELPLIHSNNEVKLSTLITPRNFYTNRPKKGTYGFTGLTIGQRGEIEYMSDPYGGVSASQASTTTNTTDNKDIHRIGPPFKAAVKSGRCFDESEHGFSQVYSLSKPLLAKANHSMPTQTADEMEKAVGRKPWVPGGALVKELTKSYEYVEDPLDWKERQRRAQQQQEMQYKPWHPVGTDRYRYIYTKPIAYDPPEIV